LKSADLSIVCIITWKFISMRENEMKLPEWLKPAIYGAVAGAVAISIAGFSWGGWVTGGSAREMAADQAHLEVVAALVPVCVEQSNQDPNAIATLASLKGEAATYKRGEMLMKTGWATMPGSTDPDRNVAKACMDKLAEQF
jgi:hypothetical protein